MADTLVIGIGDPLRGDDGAGQAVIQRLRQRPPAGAELLCHWGEGTGLMALWRGRRRLVLVDAMVCAAPPGSLRCFDAAELPPAGLFPYSTHRFGVVEALRLAAVLGELPRELLVVGIAGERFEAGSGLSPAVAQGVDQAAEIVQEWLAAGLSTAPRAVPRSASR